MLANNGKRTPSAKRYLQSGKVNAVNAFGNTHLSLPSHAGHMKVARWLLSKGGSTDARPHGHDMATWIKMGSGSGLPKAKHAEVLYLIGHKDHSHYVMTGASLRRSRGKRRPKPHAKRPVSIGAPSRFNQRGHLRAQRFDTVSVSP